MVQLFAQLLCLFLIIVSVAGLWLIRGKNRFRRILRIICIIAIPVGVIGTIGSCGCITWDGGYGRAEFEIIFRDPKGEPVPGVELRVEDSDGRAFFLYPVTDYLPDHTPTSDEQGRMIFHHVSNAIEFSGRSCEVFFYWVEIWRGPRFICRFLLKGKEVARTTFGELDRWEQTWETVPKVKRPWKSPIWPASELYATYDESFAELVPRLLKYYGTDETGRLSPEAAPALHAAASFEAEAAAIAWLSKRERIEEEVEFPIVRRTIMVPSAEP